MRQGRTVYRQRRSAKRGGTGQFVSVGRRVRMMILYRYRLRGVEINMAARKLLVSRY